MKLSARTSSLFLSAKFWRPPTAHLLPPIRISLRIASMNKRSWKPRTGEYWSSEPKSAGSCNWRGSKFHRVLLPSGELSRDASPTFPTGKPSSDPTELSEMTQLEISGVWSQSEDTHGSGVSSSIVFTNFGARKKRNKVQESTISSWWERVAP